MRKAVPKVFVIEYSLLVHIGLHFAWVVDDVKCIVVTSICVCVCVSVSLSVAACPHYCMNPDVTWVSGRGCLLVVHYWADLQSVHGLRWYDNITRTWNVIALCLVFLLYSYHCICVLPGRYQSTFDYTLIILYSVTCMLVVCCMTLVKFTLYTIQINYLDHSPVWVPGL